MMMCERREKSRACSSRWKVRPAAAAGNVTMPKCQAKAGQPVLKNRHTTFSLEAILEKLQHGLFFDFQNICSCRRGPVEPNCRRLEILYLNKQQKLTEPPCLPHVDYIFTVTLNRVVLHVTDSETRCIDFIYLFILKNTKMERISASSGITTVAGWLMCTDLHSDTSRVEVGHWSRLLLIKMKWLMTFWHWRWI